MSAYLMGRNLHQGRGGRNETNNNYDVGNSDMNMCGRERYSYRGRGRNAYQGNSGITCYNCGKAGHISRDCWHNQGRDGYARQNHTQGNFVQEQNHENVLMMNVNTDATHSNDVWYVDSGRSNHMNNNYAKMASVEFA
ncbi:hypothetical protein KP509_24G065800 [Ceratopteris richardii]|uniref:CCHC-type domain-containing protein n=1 Tax=Ceratopteris richardii TaxID=49495 RepID=A0A8T2RY29_CERRI|nr:hypothetical protein KP509_24G065800 [Ceratopteris richardii]